MLLARRKEETKKRDNPIEFFPAIEMWPLRKGKEKKKKEKLKGVYCRKQIKKTLRKDWRSNGSIADDTAAVPGKKDAKEMKPGTAVAS